jgi:CheY-like chemotaxis protein
MSTIQELLNLSNQMLRMNWNDKKGHLGSRQVINLNKVVKDIKDVMELTANAKGCRVIATIDTTLPPILIANGLHLQCLLIYLLNNLIQYSQSGEEIILNITTRQLLKDRKIILNVTIDHKNKSLLERIDFQIVNQFIHALNGKIEKPNESRSPLISFTASFVIPLLETIMASFKVNSKHFIAKAATQYNVLLVEDHLLAQFAAEHTLAGFHCAVDIARTGKEALQKTKKQEYDIIFMDLGLPDGRGVNFVQKIYDQPKGLNCSTPIVAVTAHATAEERNQCKEIGMYTVVHKPLSAEAAMKIFKTLKESRAKLSSIELEEPKPREKPVIDLILGAELVDSDIRKAQGMLAIFIYLLSDAQHAIQQAYYAKDIQNLIAEVHKLYGAACYCGVPRLIEALFKLETALKSNKYQNIAPLYQDLMKEIQQLMDEYEPSGF